MLNTLDRRRLEKRSRLLMDRLERLPFERRDIWERHHIELTLARHLGPDPPSLIEDCADPVFGNAILFGLFTHGLFKHLQSRARSRLLGRLKQGLKEDYGFAALRTEYVALNMALKLNCAVTPVDLDSTDSFDFLLSKMEDTVEMECKLHTLDFGSTFTLSRFRRFTRLLNLESRERLLRPGSSSIVTMVLRGDLPASDADLRALAEDLCQFVEGGSRAQAPLVATLTREPWEHGVVEPFRVHAEARLVTLSRACPTIALEGDRSALILALKAEESDPRLFRDRIVRRLKQAADQLSGHRPALLFVELEGPYPDMFQIEVVRRGYEAAVRDFFRARPHVELIILGFAGPPFSSGATFRIRNPRKKRRNQTYLMRDLERRTGTRLSSDIPHREFRQAWWKDKYDWSYRKAPGEDR